MLNIAKRSILITVDAVLINLSFISALYFRFMKNIDDMYLHDYINRIIVITILYIISFYIFRLYESLWVYASIDEFILSISGCIVGTIMSIIYSVYTHPRVPYSVVILTGIFSVIYVFGFRISFRIYRRLGMYLSHIKTKEFKKVLIIGAGSAGNIIVNEMKNHPRMKYNPVGFIDDNKYKVNRIASGVKVLGTRKNIEEVAQKRKVEEIIIAIPSLGGNNKKEIIEECKKTGCRVKIIPSICDLIEGKLSLDQVRDVQVEDLLGREPIELEGNEINGYLRGKSVLVTGGGGSIGSELCRQIAKFKPKQLIILDIYENNAYELQNELMYSYPDLSQKVLIACIKDRCSIEKVFNEYRPEVVFHAAAHKHVPLMEECPQEAIKNNVFGTLNVAECADKYKVKKFVMISTDKAVNPTNIMGASKRICEMIIQAMSRNSETAFVAVRFGNVLGSNGSVIPLFKKQILNGGPVTVTSKEITRYFMTIPEASQLVLQAGAYAKGGEIFVLDMGKPIKIYDLACDLIRLSGFEPHKDIKINLTGLRPGEKLYEELLTEEEGLEKTTNNKIFIGKSTYTSLEFLKRSFEDMKDIAENGTREELIEKIRDLVPSYNNPVYFEELDMVEEEVAQTTNQRYEEANGLGVVL